MMGFTEFPTETFAEAMETMEFLESHKEYWVLASVGKFSLFPKTTVARNYRKFGIKKITYLKNCDCISSPLYYEQINPVTTLESEMIEKKKREIIGEFYGPLMGGVDAAHTLFYLDFYGKEKFKEVVSLINPKMLLENELQSKKLILAGYKLDSLKFEPYAILENRNALQSLIDRLRLKFLHLDIKTFRKFDQSPKVSLRRSPKSDYSFYVVKQDSLVRIPEAFGSLIGLFDGSLSLSELVTLFAELDETNTLLLKGGPDALRDVIISLIGKGVITLLP